MVQQGDMVLVAFSGHGVQRNGESYLCPQDAQTGDARSLVRLNDVFDQLERCHATNKVLLVDACRNEPQPDNQRGAERPDEIGKFAVAQAEQPPRHRHADQLLARRTVARGQRPQARRLHELRAEGSRGEADTNNDGKIYLDELWRYVSENTTTYVAHKFNAAQTPWRQLACSDFELRGCPTSSSRRPAWATPRRARRPSCPKS